LGGDRPNFARPWQGEEIPKTERHNIASIEHIFFSKFITNGKAGGKLQ
jgi:hypothetical protein